MEDNQAAPSAPPPWGSCCLPHLVRISYVFGTFPGPFWTSTAPPAPIWKLRPRSALVGPPTLFRHLQYGAAHGPALGPVHGGEWIGGAAAHGPAQLQLQLQLLLLRGGFRFGAVRFASSRLLIATICNPVRQLIFF